MNSLDAYLPSYEFSTRHEVAVDAPSDIADRALREVTFRDVPVVCALLFARGEGAHRPDEPLVATMVPKATVSTETRVHVPDPVSRRKFVRYWRIVRPFSGLIRTSILRAAKRRAEAAA